MQLKARHWSHMRIFIIAICWQIDRLTKNENKLRTIFVLFLWNSWKEKFHIVQISTSASKNILQSQFNMHMSLRVVLCFLFVNFVMTTRAIDMMEFLICYRKMLPEIRSYVFRLRCNYDMIQNINIEIIIKYVSMVIRNMCCNQFALLSVK